MTPACWACEEPCEDLGYADVSTREDRVELRRFYRCPICGEEYIAEEGPPEDWRRLWRARVREVRAIARAGGRLPVRGQP
jgi:hypothetical protein